VSLGLVVFFFLARALALEPVRSLGLVFGLGRRRPEAGGLGCELGRG